MPQVLARTGAKWMGMRDAGISFRPPTPAPAKLPPGYVQVGITERPPPPPPIYVRDGEWGVIFVCLGL